MITEAAPWQPLIIELDLWAAEGKSATFWWRDDDAIAPTLALDSMLDLVERYTIPLGLAVIPARLTSELAPHLRSAALVDVLQHGYRHHNHSIPGERAAEFGPQRPLDQRLREIADGQNIMQQFHSAAPIFVPPWNRYDPDLAVGLKDIGINVVSAFGAARQLPDGIVECNCHCDIISWRTNRGFAGIEKSVNKLVQHLSCRRTGLTPINQPTGVLTHHLDHDAGCWKFLDDLFKITSAQSATAWLRPIEAAAKLNTSRCP